MRTSALVVAAVACLLAGAPERVAADAPARGAGASASPARRAPEAATYFEANRGQSAPEVEFLARCRGYVAFLTPGAATFKTDAGAFRMRFVGASGTSHARGLESAPGRSNYLIGSDASKWTTDVPHFASVACDGALPGVDVVWRGDGRSVAYDLSVAPGVDPSAVRLRFDGADAVALNERGDVVLTIDGGTATMSAPRAYQDLEDGRRDVAAAFAVGADGEVSFEVGAHDPARRLVIDPSFTVSTYIGGSNADAATSVATDATGAVYVAGSAQSANFPTTAGAFQTVHGVGAVNYDAFVTKFASSGTSLVYSTFIGAYLYDFADGLAPDPSGGVFVCGQADSNFPLANAYKTTGDGFVAKLSAAGNALTWSTRMTAEVKRVKLDGASAVYALDAVGHVFKFTAPGTAPAYDRDLSVAGSSPGGTGMYDIAVAPSGAVWAVGANSTAGQATAGSLQTTYGGGAKDGWIVSLATNGSILSKSYFGGAGDDAVVAAALDSSGNLYVAGDTTSTDLPARNPYQSSYAGNRDMFAAKLDSSATSLVWSTYLGGPSAESVGNGGIAVHGSGETAVVGSSGGGFPTASAPQTTYGGGGSDAVFAEFAVDGWIVQSSYAGGSSDDYARAVAFDAQGRAFVAGGTASGNFPTTASAFQPTIGAVGVPSGFLVGFPAAASIFTDVSPATLPGATVGAPYAGQLSVGGGTAPFTWTVFNGSPPAGLSLAPSGALTGVPTAVGTFSFVARVVESGGARALRTFSVTVNPSPAVATTTLPAWTVGRPYSAPLAAAGGTAPFTWTLKTGTLPPGATVDSSGAVVAAAALTQAGTFTFVVQVFDAFGVGAQGSVSMTVHPAPRVTTPTPSDATEFRPVDLKFEAADGTPPFQWSVVSGIAPVDRPIDGATGSIKGSAAPAGDYAFTIRATDAAGAVADRAYAMHVNAAPFLATDELPWAARNRPYSFTVKEKGGTAPLAWSVASGTAPAGVAIVPATGELVGTPTKAGRFKCTVRCSDSSFAFDERTYAFVVADAVAASQTIDFRSAKGAPALRYVELLAGAELTIVVARRGALPVDVKLYDASQTAVDFDGAATSSKGRWSVRKFRVPKTGRYFLEMTPTAAFKGRVSLRVQAPPKTRWTGTATLDASGTPIVVPFLAPPGAKLSARVAAGRKSKARPTIAGVTDAATTELLVPAERRETKTGATLSAKTPLVGGGCALTIAPRGGLAGDVVWTVTLKLPRRFAFALPDVPTEGAGK